MTDIGYVTMPVIPSLRGVEAEINRQLGNSLDRAGLTAGQKFSTGFASGARDVGKIAAAGFAVASAGAAALAASTLKTGLAYNQLETSARITFKTLLGSKQASDAFVDSLKALSKTSPFPRQAFIEGAQQLVAFGRSSDKVIADLDAIQNAVAAVPGANPAQKLSEIVFVMGQISAAGKITGRDLIQFGDRGIDAATLIGSQMGKTGAEIRNEITKGAIGADEALDALSAGMQEKFGGIAGELKNTFTGATDRVKGALRDIGGALVDPFVGSDGGGAAVEWANQLADALRAIESQVIPKLIPSIEGFADSIDHVVDSLAGIATPTGLLHLSDTLVKIAPVASAAAAAIGAVGSQNLGVLSRFLPAINPVVAGLAALVVATPEARDAIGQVASEVAPLVAQLADDLAPVLEDLSKLAGEVLPPAIELFGESLKLALEAVDALAGPISSLTGFLADHEQVVLVLGTAYAALKAAQIGGAVFSTVAGGAAAASKAVQELGVALRTAMATEGISGVVSELGSLKIAAGGVATTLGAMVGVVGTAAIAWDTYSKAVARAAGDQSVEQIAAGIAGVDFSGKTDDMQAWDAAFSDLIDGLSHVDDSTWDNLRTEGVASAFAGNKGDVEAIKKFDQALRLMFSLDPTQAALAYQKAIEITGGDAKKAALLFPTYTAAVKLAGVGNQEAVAPTEALTQAIDQQAEAMERQIQPILDSIDAQTGLISAKFAVEDAYKAVADAADTAAGKGEVIAKLEADRARQAQQDAETVASARQHEADSLKAIETAQRAVLDSEEALSAAHKAEQKAQEGVTAAYEAARERLADLQRQQEGNKLSVEEAKNALIEAQDALNGNRPIEDDPNTAVDERAQAQIRLRRAELALEEAQRKAAESAKDLTDAKAKGAAGSDEVTAAEERLKDAHKATLDAEQRHRDSIDGVAQAERDHVQAARDTARAVQESSQHQVDAQKAIVKAQNEARANAGRLQVAALEASASFIKAAQDAKVPVDAIRGGLQSLLNETQPGSALYTSIQGIIQLLINAAQIQAQFTGQTFHVGPGVTVQRWGGVMQDGMQAFAGGGFSGVTPAHIATRQVIKYAEPETGGEAFIPKFGNHDRSEAIAKIVAGWLGGEYITKAAKDAQKRLTTFGLPVQQHSTLGGDQRPIINLKANIVTQASDPRRVWKEVEYAALAASL